MERRYYLAIGWDTPIYQFGFTGFKPAKDNGKWDWEPPDPFDEWVKEVRRIQELEDQIQGS